MHFFPCGLFAAEFNNLTISTPSIQLYVYVPTNKKHDIQTYRHISHYKTKHKTCKTCNSLYYQCLLTDIISKFCRKKCRQGSVEI